MTTLNATKVRNNFFNLVEEVQKNASPLTVTIHGEPKVVMMPADEFEGWLETMEVIQEFPNLKEDIKKAEKDIARGDYVTLEDVLKEEGFVYLNSKSKKNVQSRTRKKSK